MASIINGGSFAVNQTTYAVVPKGVVNDTTPSKYGVDLVHLSVNPNEVGLHYYAMFDLATKSLFIVRNDSIYEYDLSTTNVPTKWSDDPIETNFRKVSISQNYIFLAGRNEQILYNRATKTRVTTFSSSYNVYVNASAYLSSSGTNLIKVVAGTQDQIEVIDVATLAVTHTMNRYAASSYGANLYLSSDGVFAFWQTTSTVSSIYNLNTNTLIGTVPIKSTNSAHVSDTDNPDYFILVHGSSGNDAIALIKLSTASIVATANIPITPKNMARMSANEFCVNTQDNQYLFEINTTLETITLTKSSDVKYMSLFPYLYGGQYKYENTIVESLVTDDFDVLVYDHESGDLVAHEIKQSGAFAILLNSPRFVRVTVRPRINKGEWKGNTNYVIGDLVYSDDPNNYDWVYRCVVSGLSAISPPAWGTTAGIQFADGSVTWEPIEPISEPISKEPIRPVPV